MTKTMAVRVAGGGCSGGKIEEGCSGDTRGESTDGRGDGDDDRVFNGVDSGHGVVETSSLENPVKTQFVCVWTRLIPIRSAPGTPARPARRIHVLYGTLVALPIAARLVHSRLSPHLPPISLVAPSCLDYSPTAIVSLCT